MQDYGLHWVLFRWHEEDYGLRGGGGGGGHGGDWYMGGYLFTYTYASK